MTKKRILVIDDECTIGFVISACLEEFGSWKVFLADNGNEGLILAKTELPDAILLDVMMPEMDGITLFHYLRSEPITQKIPVIFLTAKVQSSDLRQFSNIGATGIISKPFDPLKLVEQITEILEWK
jgi:CheY-like chemotaxis protein